MSARFYPQCPICGWTGSASYNALKVHYQAEHSEFYKQYRFLNRQFIRVSLALATIGLGLAGLILIGFMRWLILGWGGVMLGWLAYFLLVWEPGFDQVADRSNDEWRNSGKSSSLDQPVKDQPRRTSNSILCPICKQGPYRLGLGIRYHNRLQHAEYFAWYTAWALSIEKIAVVTGLVILGLFGTGLLDPLLSSNFSLLILLAPVLSLVLVFAINRSRHQGEARQSWSENHHRE